MQSLCSRKRGGSEEAIKLEEILAEGFLELKKEMNLQIASVLNFESYTNEKESTPRLITVKTKVIFTSFFTQNFPFLFPYFLLNFGHDSVGCNIPLGIFYFLLRGV